MIINNILDKLLELDKFITEYIESIKNTDSDICNMSILKYKIEQDILDLAFLFKSIPDMESQFNSIRKKYQDFEKYIFNKNNFC